MCLCELYVQNVLKAWFMVFAPMYENDMLHGTFVLNVLLEAICDIAYG